MQKLLLSFLLTFSTFSGFGQDLKALIIGIDGCRPDALRAANTPNLDQLITQSIFAPDALNDDITISGPGWSAILCGVWSDKHLVTGNDFTSNNYEAFPSLFKRVETASPLAHTVSICHWGPINDHIIGEHADFKSNVSTDAGVAQQASAYLSLNNPDLMFLHFDDVDHAGHSSGFSPDVPAYIAAIEGVDAYVGMVLESLESRPSYENEDWLVMVTTDHGGKAFSHGGTSIEEENVFIIAKTNRLPPAIIQKDSMVVYTAPENCLENSVELQFDGVNDHVQIPAGSLFDFGSDQDFTVECRVRTSQPGDVAIVGNKNWNSGLNPGFVFSFKYPSGPQWKVNIGDGSNRVDLNNGGLIADGEWHTLSVTFDRDAYMVMYEDGIAIDSADISNIGNINTGQGLFFGTDFNGNYPYQGAIAETRLWNTVLDGQTINQWHCSSLEDSHPNYDKLIGYWKLTEGAGAEEVTDDSANDNDGLISEASWVTTPDSMIVYDFNNTRRLTDVAVTVLTHLCIPIDENWELDGQSLIPECLMTAAGDTQNLSDKFFQIIPNPAKEVAILQLTQWTDEPFSIKIHGFDGKLVFETKGTEPRTHLDLNTLPGGLYWVEVQIAEKSWIQKMVRI